MFRNTTRLYSKFWLYHYESSLDGLNLKWDYPFRPEVHFEKSLTSQPELAKTREASDSIPLFYFRYIYYVTGINHPKEPASSFRYCLRDFHTPQPPSPPPPTMSDGEGGEQVSDEGVGPLYHHQEHPEARPAHVHHAHCLLVYWAHRLLLLPS